VNSDNGLPEELDVALVSTAQLDELIHSVCRLMVATDELLDGLGKLMSHQAAYGIVRAVGESFGRGEGWAEILAIETIRTELTSRPDFGATWYVQWLDELAEP
jgi:hypothetical protein